MKFIINTSDKNFIKPLSELISRRGYTIYEKPSGYGVANLEKPDQDKLSIAVAQLCDHHNVSYNRSVSDIQE